MEIESPAYTNTELIGFLDEMQERDGKALADRLERASRRLAEVGSRVKAGRSDGREWSDHEVLAQMRDAAIDQMASQDPAELLRTALADHQRTIKTLRTATGDALRRTVLIDDELTMTEEAIARLPLISHLEAHVEQLERVLGR